MNKKWDRALLELGMLEIQTDATLLRRARQNPVVSANKDLIARKANAREHVAKLVAEKLKRMPPCEA
jgi:hypothetical protein